MMESTTLKISGMTCQGCVKSVTRVLTGLPGVANVDVSLDRGEAKFDFDPSKAVQGDFRRVVEDAGFEVK
jgi:copper chaperone